MSRILASFDRFFDRVYSPKYNPLYQSGTIAVALLAVMLVTGIYLLIFYKVSAPYDSVAAMHRDVWVGRWIRSLHRYSADAALVAIFVHAFRLFVQRRTWGPRLIAWVSGVVLTGIFLIAGWTGLIMIWDRQGQLIALEGARLIDLLPVFSEPLQRTFQGAVNPPRSFFFFNLFLHLALPLGMILALWIHIMRLARPALFPPRPLLWGLVASLLVLSLVWPSPLGMKADPRAIPSVASLDLFYSFWIPLARALPPAVQALIWAALSLLLFSIPAWRKAKGGEKLPPSFVDAFSCTGCTHCYQDCPYNAIQMVPRTLGTGSERVAHVDPDVCVSCGICAASCAPMGVGPPGRTGKDQLKRAQEFSKGFEALQKPLVAMVCEQGLKDLSKLENLSGLRLYPVNCSGNIHTTVIEYFLRRGAPGVMIFSCPPRNCVNREGPKWLEARLYHDHEAELRPSADRRRIRMAVISPDDFQGAKRAVEVFRSDLARLDLPAGEAEPALNIECEEVLEAKK